MDSKSGKNPQKIEFPMGRTYGECIIAELSSVVMIDGVFSQTLHIKDKPKRLKKEEAIRYYTLKLKKMWELAND